MTREDNLPDGCTPQRIDDSAGRDVEEYEMIIDQIVQDMKGYGRTLITCKDILRYSLIEDKSDKIKLWASQDPDARRNWEDFVLSGYWYMLDVVLDTLARKVNEQL